MKIALIIERMDASRGGRETSTAQIAAELARRGQDVTILCQQGSLDGAGVIVKQLGNRGAGRCKKLTNFIADVEGETKTWRYHIVHAMLPIPSANVYQPRGGTIPGQFAASLRRRPAMVRPLLKLFNPLNRCRAMLGKLERQIMANPRTIALAVSDMVAAEFKRFYGRKDNVRMIYNAADVPDPIADQRAQWRKQLRAKLNVAEGDAVFLTIATNFALKGVAQTIESFARFYHSQRGDRTARLVIVGRTMPEGYQRHASLRDVGPMVAFVPPTADIFQWYAAADACVLLSWYDPCSRVLLEAARWGVPSLTTAFNGATELLGEGCIVVDSPRARRPIVEALDALADPRRREVRSRACLKVAPQLSVERHVDGLLEAYAKAPPRS